MVIDQDTWILNVASNIGVGDSRWRHFAQIRLPPELNEAEAKLRSEYIESIFANDPVNKWKFDLTRWEMSGHDIKLAFTALGD